MRTGGAYEVRCWQACIIISAQSTTGSSFREVAGKSITLGPLSRAVRSKADITRMIIMISDYDCAGSSSDGRTVD